VVAPHSLVSKLAELGSPAETIKAISGHTTEQMLALYTHISQKAKRDVLVQLDVPPQTVQ
jgi:integrase